MLFGIVFVQIVFAQSAWLSTDESVNTFRSQVESAKPAISKYPQINTDEFQIPLKGRQITVRVYDSGDNNQHDKPRREHDPMNVSSQR